MPHSASVCALSAMALVWGGQATTLETITIQVVNSAKVEHATLARAERDAARAFEQAGVQVEWRDCAAQACAEDLGPGEFWMHVALWRPASTCDRTMGFTFQEAPPNAGAHLAGANYPMVREFAWEFGFDESAVLGAVLAHEIGHLLGVGHSRRGVMTEQFDRSRIVEISGSTSWFSGDQSRRMRSFIGRFRAASLAASEGVATR